MTEEKDKSGLLGRIGDAVRGRKRSPKQEAKPKARAKVQQPRSRSTPAPAIEIARRPAFATGGHPLMDGHPPDWASGWGDDRQGVWVELTVGDATQRMRWIGPGRFLMGSPEDEQGRIGESEGRFNEGPRHEVRISWGFWLFDTPVTQALWEAVMSSNPSRFVDPKRPVERVSWDEAMAFIGRINAIIPDLDLVLPTEAQWEYACRAGTNTATYAGPMEILGTRNAPILDAIAWYGGNSGVEFDLHEGEDSSSWPDKQYEHSRAGTRPDGQKKLNPWGCHDMLGNVWEWCADDMRKYTADPATDPFGSRSSARRALRGGPWNGTARSVRAAYRFAYARDDLYDVIGFRCARVRP